MIPYIVSAISGLKDELFAVSIVMTGAFLFILGVSKSFFTYSPWWKCGFETLFVGACTAGSSYLIGYAFEGIDT